MLLHAQFVARRSHVDAIRQQRDTQRPVAPLPRDRLQTEMSQRVFGNVDQVRVATVDAVAFGLHVDQIAVVADHVFKGPSVVATAVDLKLFAQAPALEDQCPAGVFLFDAPHQVRRVTDLRLDLFLAVAEVVVGDDRDDDSFLGTARQFEGFAIVVEFVG